MSEIFRFLMLRPPEPADPVTVSPSSRYLTRLDEARQHGEGRIAVREASEAVIADYAVTTIDDLPMAGALLELDRVLRGLASDPPVGDMAAAVGKAAEDVLGDTPKKVMADPAITTLSERLQDLLIASKVLSRDGAVEAVRLETGLRTLDLVRRFADGTTPLADAAALWAALGRSSEVRAIVPPREKPRRRGEPQPPGDDRDDRIKELRATISRLTTSADALVRLDPDVFERPEEAGGGRRDAEPSAKTFVARRLAEAGRSGDLSIFGSGAVSGFVADLDLVTVVADADADARVEGPRLVLSQDGVRRLDEGVLA